MPLEAFGVFLILAAVAAAVSAFLVTRGARSHQAFSNAVLMLGAALVAYGHGIELLNDRPAEMVMGRSLYLLGWGLVAPAFLAMAQRFADSGRGGNAEWLIKVYGPPLALALGGATNGYHHLFYRVSGIDWVDGRARLAIEPAFFHWLNVLVLLGYGACGIAVVLRGRSVLARRHRRAALYLALSGVPVVVAGILFLLGWRVYGVVNPVPFALTLGVAIHFATAMRKDLVDVRPLARDLLMERLPDGVIVVDGQGTIIDHNAEALRLLGLPSSILGRSANDALIVLPRVAARIASGTQAEFELNGRIIELRTARIERAKARHAGLIIQIHDSTEARRMERALATSLQRETQLGMLGRALSVTHRLDEVPGVTLPLVGAILDADSCDLYIQSDGMAIGCSWTPAGGVVDDGGQMVPPPADGVDMLTLMLDPRGSSIGTLTARRKGRPFDEADTTVAETVRWLVSNALANTLLMLDMERAARTDALTGLDNRASFVEAGEREILLSIRHSRALCLAICDLDHFKAVNDRYGHAVGDAVLVEAARRIAASTRSTDLVARWGGEEFAILMPEADIAAGRIAAERIRRRLGEEPFELDGGVITMTVSIGVASHDCAGGEWLGALTERADRALYAAKNGGRNRVMIDSSS